MANEDGEFRPSARRSERPLGRVGNPALRSASPPPSSPMRIGAGHFRRLPTAADSMSRPKSIASLSALAARICRRAACSAASGSRRAMQSTICSFPRRPDSIRPGTEYVVVPSKAMASPRTWSALRRYVLCAERTMKSWSRKFSCAASDGEVTPRIREIALRRYSISNADARSEAKRAAAPSRISRIAYNSITLSGVISVTTRPREGVDVTKPSALSRCRASRTGVRLTLSLAANSISRNRSPDWSLLPSISSLNRA